MKFLNDQGLNLEYLEQFNVVSNSISPFKEIVEKKSDFNFSIELDKAYKNEEVFQMQINVKHAGSFTFLFVKEGFEKDKIVNDVVPLKDMQSKDNESTLNKIDALYKVMKKYSPLLSIYSPSGKYSPSIEQIKSLCENLLTFYLQEEVKEESKEDKGEKKEFKFENPFKVIAKDRFHFLFAFVAAFLIGFTVSISIYDIYANKLIYIFFLVCCLAGMVLNAFIYSDTFQSHTFKDMNTIMTIVSNLAGFGLSLGAYAIFTAITPDKLKNPPAMWMLILIILGALALSACGSLIILMIKRRKSR